MTILKENKMEVEKKEKENRPFSVLLLKMLLKMNKFMAQYQQIKLMMD